MYKIGVFADMCQISSQTLRYYERIGLLSPQHTDPFTGYRYYTSGQIAQVNRIMALKALGFSLEQIHDLFNENITNQQIEIMLKLKRAETQNLIDEALERIQHIDFYLYLLEKENVMIDIDITIKPIDAVRVLSCAQTYETEQGLNDFYVASKKAISEANVPLKHDYVMGIAGDYGFENRLNNFEVAYPVDDDFDDELAVGDAVMSVRTLDGHDLAVTVMHKGPYAGAEGMRQTVRILNEWFEQNPYEVVDTMRITYLTAGTDVNPEERRIQMQLPVKKVDS